MPEDDAPVQTRQYWVEQNSIYATSFEDPEFQAELGLSSGSEKEYKQFLPSDPSHPRAYIPMDVRFSKRKSQGFVCAVTGWKETDWIRDKQKSGPYRLVGRLTIDHEQAGANGGLTTDQNTKMICELANTKKGSKVISYEKLREVILSAYEVVDMPEDLLAVVQKYGIKQYKV